MIATLRGQERVVSGSSGKHRTTYTHNFFEEKIALAETVEVPSGKATCFEAVHDLPADALSTFVAPSNSIQWKVVFHLDIHRWPDWKRDIPFTVVP